MDFDLTSILIMTPILLMALPFHEFSHAFVANRMGDPTAKDAGRLTLNPLKHLDILGVIMMYVAHIGWAKPVPVNSGYFKNRRKGMILVSLAGPLSNLLLAFVFTLLWGILAKMVSLGAFNSSSIEIRTIISYVYIFFDTFIYVNIALAIFNLIPIPPLDGSRLLSSFIPEESYFRFAKYEQYIGLGFIVLVIFVSNVLKRPDILSGAISFFADPIYNSMQLVTTYIFGI